MQKSRLDVRIGVQATPVGELIYDVSGHRDTSIFTISAHGKSLPSGGGGAAARHLLAVRPVHIALA